MTFTPYNAWLWQHPDYVKASERVSEARRAFDSLHETMSVFETVPLDSEKIAEHKARVDAATEARREVELRLTNEHSKGEHVEPK
jgi:hypothetical protein